MGPKQTYVLLARWQDTGAPLGGDWLRYGGPWQHLGVQQGGQAAVPHCATPIRRDPWGHTWDTMASASPG